MRVLRNIIFIALMLAAILLAAAFILARVFEDELTQYVIGGLNRHIRAEVKVEDVKLSFLKKFPDASVEFRDVFIASVPDFQENAFGPKNTDTLLSAGHLFLSFNVVKLLKREYILREVQVRSGRLNLLVDPEGNGNYRFWEKKEGTGEKDFVIELENVRLAEIHVEYDNRALGIELDGLIRRSNLKGRFSMESYRMSTGLEGMVLEYSNKGKVLLSKQKIQAGASFSIDPRVIEIVDGNLILAGQHLIASGRILRPGPPDLEISLEGKQLDLEYLLKHVLMISEKYPEDLRAGGKLDFRGRIKGIASSTRMPGIEAEFSLDEGWLQTPILQDEVRDLKVSGTYSNGNRHSSSTTTIRLGGLSLRYGNSRLGGETSVYNLASPDFNYNIKTELDLADIQQFIPQDSPFKTLQGRVLAEVRMEGDQALLRHFNKEDLLHYEFHAVIRFEGLNMQMGKIPLNFSDLSGEAEFTDHLEVRSMSGMLEGNRVSLSGRVDNLLEFLLTPEGNLWMDLNFYSERMDLNYLRSIEPSNHSAGNSHPFMLPERLFLRSRFWFDELEIKNFRATLLTGDLVYKPRRLEVTHLELLSMNGRIKSEGILEQQQDLDFLVRSNYRIRSVDITGAFRAFDNFGQQFLVDEHLSGTLDGTVNFSAGLDERMKIKKETILADCDIAIRNGQLSGFEPMLKLSKFIDVAELENIQFSTLTNEVFIRNQQVVIPRMDIRSSAFEISASGVHGFDRHFTYKLKVALSEFLASKSARAAQQESEFGPIEDDGLGKVYLYLIIEGDPDGTDIRYDRRGAILNIQEQLSGEKQELKEILREEFGWFKKDSALEGEDGDDQFPAFIIEWEEDRDSVKKEDLKEDNIQGSDRFIIEWDENGDEDIPDEPVKDKKRKRIKRKG